MKKNYVYVKWGTPKEALALKIEPAELEIKAANTHIILRQREIIIENKIKKYEDKTTNKRKYFYIYLSENIQPIKPPKLDITDYEVINGFEIRTTNIELTKYLTIITPGPYLYNYIILSNNIIGGETNTRRQLFYEKTNNKLTIYLL